MHIRAETDHPVTADLDPVLRKRLAFAGVATPDATLAVIGPFASFTADDDALVAGRTRAGLRSTGWRGLLIAAEAPLAVVELSRRHSDSARAEQLRVAVRPGDPALAMQAALAFISDARPDDPAAYRLTWLTIPGLYITCFVLDGPRRFYVPTRAGFGPRPAPALLDPKAFLALIRRERGDRRRHGRQRRASSLKSATDFLPIGG